MFVIEKTFEDFNGEERTEKFRFHLSKAELLEMELSQSGGLKNYLEKIIAARDTPTIAKVFKDLLCKSYGEISDNGREFIKNEALLRSFMQTEAYSEIFTDLATDDDFAAAFINGIIPDKVRKQLEANNNVVTLPVADKPTE